MSNLTSLDIYYKFDDGNPILYKWTGNLKYMNFTKVNLNPIYLGLGSHKLSIYSENPNNSVDENRNNDSLKVNFNTVSGNQVTISLKTDNFADETSWTSKILKIILSFPILLSKQTLYIILKFVSTRVAINLPFTIIMVTGFARELMKMIQVMLK